MTLRPEYSLGHSEYNAFLFAAVGEEKVGLPLTVLTALTRLGFDPWREAARLSDLPRETAARRKVKKLKRPRNRSTVRRQINRVRSGLCRREDLAHLLIDVKRRLHGGSSVGSGWSVV